MPRVHQTWQVLPHSPLQEIDDGILTVAGNIPMPLGNFPRRMTVVRLASGKTAIFSAIALPEPEMAQIEAMGEPAVLIVPNGAHRLDAKAWKQRYGLLRVLTPAGARDDVAQVVPVDATTDILDDPDVRFVSVAGTEDRDSALIIRRATGHTIVCNDIIGHVRHPHGIGAKVMSRMMGFGVSEPSVPRPARLFHIKSPKALAQQLREWAALGDLQRIIVSHGDPITDDPAGTLRRIAGGLEH